MFGINKTQYYAVISELINSLRFFIKNWYKEIKIYILGWFILLYKTIQTEIKYHCIFSYDNRTGDQSHRMLYLMHTMFNLQVRRTNFLGLY